MKRTIPAVASATLAAFVLASVTVAPQRASAQTASAIAEFSSQVDHRKKVVPRGAVQPKINIAPKITVAPRVNVVPRGNVAPRNNFRVQGPGNNAVIRSQNLRGPSVGFRGPVGTTTFRGARANFIRGPHRFFRHGRYIPFLAIGTLGAIAIGSRYYSPYAFVDGPSADVCAGPTDDGLCELRMTEVPLEDGTAEMQCVSYCPQQ